MLQQLMLTIIEQMTTRCLLRWKNGEKQGPTLREHCVAYFQPSNLSLSFIQQAAKAAGSNELQMKSVYLAMVEASRLQWQKYTDEDANKVLENWFKEHHADA